MIKIHEDTFKLFFVILGIFGFGLTHMLRSIEIMSYLGVSMGFLVICSGVLLCFKIDKMDQYFKDFELNEDDQWK